MTFIKLVRLLPLLLLSLSLPTDLLAQAKGKGGPPPWAPAHGYRAKTRHIYFPQHNFYFDVQRGLYIYLTGGQWQTSIKLPSLYAKLDLARASQIELDLNNDHPHNFNADHKVKYKPTPPDQKPKAGGKPGPAGKGPGKGNGNGGGKGKKH